MGRIGQRGCGLFQTRRENAHQQGCYISEDVQKDAARYGSIECLKYLLHEHLLSINASIIANIALSGNLKCLKYFHEAGFPWDDRVTLYAATQGHLECLQYAHEQGCPWHKDTYTMAKMHDDCLDYAIEHCCPIPPYR
ncbi:MAG: hypothetical protein EBX50_19745 [Chitinophagia bacterium]|nr:hypothetical protein [Chitinophagia bacterium]